VALEQLLRINAEGAFATLVGGSPTPPSPNINESKPVIDRVPPARAELSPRDRRMVTDIVAGVTRWQRRLAWQLTNLPKPTALHSMDTPLRLLLYMGAYELLDRNMAPHAISEYVDLARLVTHDGCAKVANGVLRTVSRCVAADAVPNPPSPQKGSSIEEAAEALAIAESHPTWLVRRWIAEFGAEDTVRLLKHNNRLVQLAERTSVESHFVFCSVARRRVLYSIC